MSGRTTHAYHPVDYLTELLTADSVDREVSALLSLPDHDSEDWKNGRDKLDISIEQQAQETILRYLDGDEIPREEAEFILAERLWSAARRLRNDPENEVRKKFCAARVAIFEHEFDRAVELLDEAIAIDGFLSYLQNARGIALLEKSISRNDVEDAELAFREAIFLDPYWAYPRHNWALPN